MGSVGGALGFAKTSSKGNQETELRPQTAAEARLTAIAGDVAALQLSFLQDLQGIFPQEFAALEEEFNLFNEFTQKIQDSDEDPNKVLADLRQQQLNLATQAGLATPEELARIKETADRAIELASSDILRQQEQAITGAQTQLRSQGLRTAGTQRDGRQLTQADTPILDRASAIVQEGQRQIGQVTSAIRGQQAQQELLFPIQRQGFISDILSQQQGFEESRRNFITELQGRSLQNRLQLFGAKASLTGVPQSGAAALAVTQQPRLAQTTVRTKGEQFAFGGSITGSYGFGGGAAGG